MLVVIGILMGLFLATCVPSAGLSVRRWTRCLGVVAIVLLSLSLETKVRVDVLNGVGLLLLYFCVGWLVVNQDGLYSGWKAFKNAS
jgi:hypothetical protein